MLKEGRKGKARQGKRGKQGHAVQTAEDCGVERSKVVQCLGAEIPRYMWLAGGLAGCTSCPSQIAQ